MNLNVAAHTPLIESIGAHALPLFLGVLPALMLSIAALWCLAQRYAVPRDNTRWSPSAGRLMPLGLGFAVVVGGALLFAELAGQLLEPGRAQRMGALDNLLSAAVGRSLPASALQFFAAFTHLADTAWLILLTAVVAALLFGRQHRWLALGWTVAVAGNALLTTALKSIFTRTRPVHDNLLYTTSGWSFPSGHSSGAVVVYGMLTYVLLRTWPRAQSSHAVSLLIVLVASAIVFTVGCSRVFIQAHYASDVLAGFASGSVWLAVCIGSLEMVRHRKENLARRV